MLSEIYLFIAIRIILSECTLMFKIDPNMWYSSTQSHNDNPPLQRPKSNGTNPRWVNQIF